MNERKPRFLDVPGLIQKVCGRDEATGEVCGIYFFESREALAAFRGTELAKRIPGAYEATDVRAEVYRDQLYNLILFLVARFRRSGIEWKAVGLNNILL